MSGGLTGAARMKVHVLQHVPFEGAGSIGHWLREQGAAVGYTRFFESEDLPDPADLDLVIAMGGPMSVNDAAEFPWLVPEKQFLRTAVQQGVAVLGICLGAQLLASALGAQVRRNPQREIGWFEIKAVSSNEDVFQFPPALTVFHWHGETFDLPEGSTLLAESAACRNQAFQFGRNVIGLQFHLETTPQSADAIIDHCRHELEEGPYVQTETALRKTSPAACAAINRLMADVLSYLARQRNTSEAASVA